MLCKITLIYKYKEISAFNENQQDIHKHGPKLNHHVSNELHSQE